MPLVSMKSTKGEDEAATPTPALVDKPQYPYGLKIELNEESLAMLGVQGIPEIGSTMALTARVEVCGGSSYKTQKGEERSVSLQITDMALGGAEGAAGVDGKGPQKTDEQRAASLFKPAGAGAQKPAAKPAAGGGLY